jgi:hypothetical protein
MELCGWETRSMFKRYCIKDERALEQAAAKRFALNKGETSEDAAAEADSVTSNGSS